MLTAVGKEGILWCISIFCIAVVGDNFFRFVCAFLYLKGRNAANLLRCINSIAKLLVGCNPSL